MAEIILTGFDELQDAFKAIREIPDNISRNAVRAMGDVAVNKVKAEGEAMGVRDPDSNEHILDHIALSKPKKGRDGNMKAFITFKGVRQRGNTRTWNSAIAYINEYGAPHRGISARPFISTGMARNENEITAPAEEIIGGWIENTYAK